MKTKKHKRKFRSVIIAIVLVLATLLVLVPTVLAEGENIIGVYPASSQVTVGNKFLTNINTTVVWQIDTASILNMTFTPGVLNYSNISCGNLFSATFDPADLLIWYHPQDGEDWSVVDNETGYAKQITGIDNDVVNNTNKSLALLYWDASEVGIGYINLTDYHCYNDTIDHGTLSENTTIYVYPDYPSSFSVSSGMSWDNLTWTRGSGEDNAMIRYSTSTYPTTISEGTLLYNGSLEYNNFSKDIEEEYYYSIWGWNETFGWHSLSYDTESSSSLGGLPSGFTATTQNRTAISLNWTTEYTSTLTLRPNAPGFATEWDTNDNSNWEAVDEASADDGTTRNRIDTSGARDSYNITNHTSETATIKNVTVYSRLLDDGAGMTCRITIYDYTQGSYKNNTAFSPEGSYTTYSHTWEENPWTSSTWTWDDIDRLEVGIEYVSNEDDRIYITQTYANIIYYDSPISVVERNTFQGWERTTGTEVHNSTNVSFTDNGLWADTLYYYQLWTYDGDTNYSTTNVSANSTTDSNVGTSLIGETPSDDASGIDISYTTVNVTVSDYEGDLFNWTIEGLYITNTGANNHTGGSKSANLITPLPYSADVIWYVNTTDIYNWTNATYNFTVRDQYDPSIPSDFNATAYNRTRIDLSWTLTDDKSYLEWNTFAGWAKDSGNTLDNGTNASFSHTGLTEGTTYYYQIWSYNTTDFVFSSLNATKNDTTDANQVSTQTGEVPADDTGNVDLNLNSVNVTIEDPEGDLMDWWIETSVGNSNSGSNASNGSISCTLTTPHDYQEEVTWFVNVTDGTDWTNSTYNFTAREIYDPTPPTSLVVSAYNKTVINLSWTPEDDRTYIEYNTTSGWPQGSGNVLDNGTNSSFNHEGLSPSTQYYYQLWSFNTTDSVLGSTNTSGSNTTLANSNPTQAGETPGNGTSGWDITQSLVNITINDADAEEVSWYIETSTGDSNSSSDTGETSISCNLTTPHDYEENITWFVNITDGIVWLNLSYNFSVRSQYIPDAPTGLMALNGSSLHNFVTWTNAGNNITVLETRTGWSPPWDIGDPGTSEIYNGTSTFYTHSNLNKSTKYNYLARSYNSTDNVFSVSVIMTNRTTDSNTLPDNPSSESPTNETEWIEPDSFNITVTDPDGTFGEIVDVSFIWENNGTIIGTDTGVTNNSVASIDMFSGTNYTNYSWYVNITDTNGTTTSPTWWFKWEAYDYDVDRDSKCFPSDLSGVAAHYMESGDPHWIRADVNRGGSVGPEDLSGIAAHYMEEY